MNNSGWSKTASKYMDFYQTSIADWWTHMGPVDYVCLLVGSLFLGYLLLKGGARY